jgi:CRP/FNR family cyclic AMP-dependent transcriptional regulator
MNHSPTPAAPETTLAAPPVAPAAALSEASPTAAQCLYALIEDQPFFKGLGAPHLQRLADSAIEMRFEAGQVIFEEGSPANRFYVILEGKVLLESEVRDRGVMATQTLGAGDDLGWSWLFPPYYLHSSARALESTRMIFFYGTRLREQCEEDHDLGYEIMRRIAKVVIQRLGITQQRLMDCAGPDQAANG